jgi:hypothetical protein
VDKQLSPSVLEDKGEEDKEQRRGDHPEPWCFRGFKKQQV